MKPVVLVILDGFGVSKEKRGNAIEAANMPNYRKYLLSYPHTVLSASGESVGLPKGEAGNSEVGHLNIGAGRVVYQDLLRINMSIMDGSFFKNDAFAVALNHVKKYNSKLHIMGLFGEGYVHASRDHILSLVHLAKEQGISNVFLHLFTDGRDSSPTAALYLIQNAEEFLQKEGVGKIASLIGRYYAMDRDNRSERTQKAFELIAHGAGDKFHFAREAIEQQYLINLTDEFIPPISLINNDGSPIATVGQNDAVIFANFRPDRARELTKAFLNAGIMNLCFVTMTEYEKNLPVTKIAYPQIYVENPLGFVLQSAHLKQLHAAESEKYPHVTYFFNGQRELAFTGEDRIIVPSPKVATYDQKPEMSANELTDAVLQRISTNGYDFVVMNYANPDMVGHSGIFEKTVQACEVVDVCLGKIVNSVLEKGGTVVITADHGNAEEKINIATGQVLTEHTSNPVPIIFINAAFKPQTLTSGILADIAPTLLSIMGLPKPQEMTGKNLLGHM